MGVGGWGRPVTRRRALRLIGGTAAMCGLAGCATTARSPAPTSTHPVATVSFQLWVMFPSGVSATSPTAEKVIQGFFDQNFNAQHKGMRAVYTGYAGSTDAVVASILAGGPSPAVIAAWGPTWPAVVPFLQPLEPYMKADNIPQTLWQSGSLAQVTGPQGLYALPHDASTQSYLYRQDVLDRFGLTYPDAGWTYEDAARLWSACTDKAKQQYGASLPWQASGPSPGLAVLRGFGGGLVDPSGTGCLLGASGSIAAAEWAFPLFWNGICRPNGGVPVQALAAGTLAFTQGSADWSMLWAVQQLRDAKWDFLPFPAWPKGSFSIVQSEFYGINASFQPQEYAWELFRFLAIDPVWQRFNMRLTLNAPGLVSLLQEWATVVTSVAPVLQGKAVDTWIRPALSNQGVPAFEYFSFAPTEAAQAVSNTWGLIWNEKQGVTAGLTAIGQQVDALEAEAAKEGTRTGAERISAAQKSRQRLDAMFTAGA